MLLSPHSADQQQYDVTPKIACRRQSTFRFTGWVQASCARASKLFNLDHPPLPGSGPVSCKEFYRQLALYGTERQKVNAPVPPEFAARVQHPNVYQEYRGESFQEFLRAEDEAARPAREAQRLAAIQASEAVQGAKRRQRERESAAQKAKVAQAFRDFWAAYPVDATKNIMKYAFDRGYIPSPTLWDGDKVQIAKANAELNSESCHQAYDPSGTSWRQRAEIIREATKKKQPVTQAGQHAN
jgi:hypothetical protein